MYPIGYATVAYTLRLTEELQDWLDALKDLRAQMRIVARDIKRAQRILEELELEP